MSNEDREVVRRLCMGAADVEGFDFGRVLNPNAGKSNCPVCQHHGVMRVFEAGVQWACGCFRHLPPMGKPKVYAPGGTTIRQRRAA